MAKRWRWAVVGAVALGGLALAALGITEFRELLELGVGPPEVLHRKVPLTTVSLFLGLVMIVWVFVAGIGWARSRHAAEDQRASGLNNRR